MAAIDQNAAHETLRAVMPDGVMAILRGHQAAHLDAAIATLVEAGVRSIEITLTTPHALETLRRWAASASEGIKIGCGTVLSQAQAEAATDCGAAFVVAPNYDDAVVRACLENDVPVLPAAWTPTEVVRAWEAGATAVKLFPAALGGPAYVRHLRGPLPDVPLLPTGGVAIEDIPDYLSAGANGVGLGGPLLGDALDGGDLAALHDRARRALDLAATSLRARI